MNIERLSNYIVEMPIDEWQLDPTLPDIEIEQLVQTLKDEADRHWYIDANESLHFAEKIIAIGKFYKNPSHIALGTMAKGDALRYLARYDEAWELLVTAGNLFLEIDDEVGWARTCIGRLACCIETNHIDEAKLDAKRALEILYEHGDLDLYGRILNNLLVLQASQSEYQKSIDLVRTIDSEHGILKRLPEDLLLHFYNTLGYTYYQLGEMDRAKSYYYKRLDIDKRKQNKIGIAITKANIAFVDMQQGRFRQALLCFHNTLPIFKNTYPRGTVAFQVGVGYCHFYLNQFEEVIDVCRSTLDIAREIKQMEQVARLLVLLGTAYANLKYLDTASTCLREAYEIYSEIDAGQWVAYTLLRMGQIAFLNEHFDIAHRHLAQLITVLEPASQVYWCEARLLHARLELRDEAFHDAEAAIWDVIRIATTANLPMIQYEGHVLLGEIYVRQGDEMAGIGQYLEATAIVEHLQSNLTMAMRSTLMVNKISPFLNLIKHYLNVHDAPLAFYHLQRTKTQVWMGFLASLDDINVTESSRNGELYVEQINALRYDHHWLYQKVHNPDSLMTSAIQASDRQIYFDKLQETERQLQELLAKASLWSHHTILPQSITQNMLQDVQSTLNDTEILIEFILIEDKIHVFLVTQSDCRTRLLQTSNSYIKKLIKKLQFNIDCVLKTEVEYTVAHALTSTANTLLGKLYDELLGEIDDILEMHQRIYIVPYGLLHYIPFQILKSKRCFLIESHEVAILPFSGFLLQSESRLPSNSFILANNWDGTLEQTLIEATDVAQILNAQIYKDEECKLQAIEGQHGAVLHIAAHSEFRLDKPDLSFIGLNQEHLFIADLLRVDIRFDLVVLSACETGRAHVTSGEDLLGIGYGFLYSGTNSIVASLWRVDDLYTRQFMSQFYDRLMGGTSRIEAIRQAQLACMNDDREKHPAFWGAFQLLGKPDPLENIERKINV